MKELNFKPVSNRYEFHVLLDGCNYNETIVKTFDLTDTDTDTYLFYQCCNLLTDIIAVKPSLNTEDYAKLIKKKLNTELSESYICRIIEDIVFCYPTNYDETLVPALKTIFKFENGNAYEIQLS